VGCGIEPRNEKQIAEAETVDNVEGSMEAIVRARGPHSARVECDACFPDSIIGVMVNEYP